MVWMPWRPANVAPILYRCTKIDAVVDAQPPINPLAAQIARGASQTKARTSSSCQEQWTKGPTSLSNRTVPKGGAGRSHALGPALDPGPFDPSPRATIADPVSRPFPAAPDGTGAQGLALGAVGVADALLARSLPFLFLLLSLTLLPALSILALDLVRPCTPIKNGSEMDDDGSGMDVDGSDGPIPTGQVVPTVSKPSDSVLPFPGKPTPDGEFTTVYLDINQRNAVLQQWCTGFKLAKSGNKAELTARLRAFSGDPSRWDSLRVGATKAHRNPSGITKARSKPKQSTLRRNKLFEEVGSSSRLLSVLPTDDAFDNRTTEEKNGILAWAERFKAKNPYHPPEHPVRQVTRVGHGAPAPSVAVSGHAIAHGDIQHIKDSLALVTSRLNLLPSPSPSTPTAHSSSPSTPLPVLPTISGTPPSPLKSFTLTLGDGFRLSFTAHDVPEPPFLSFAKDLESLPPMWSDTSPVWDPSKAPFSIHGHPIALVHWRELYHCKPQQWNGLKKRWHERKVSTRTLLAVRR
ncbi:hypothetical protein EYR40_008158 [Pleurotus pulmonarius]|nr:hypothetical protein EYR40_008158 [Pleurotus pulmonarius]